VTGSRLAHLVCAAASGLCPRAVQVHRRDRHQPGPAPPLWPRCPRRMGSGEPTAGPWREHLVAGGPGGGVAGVSAPMTVAGAVGRAVFRAYVAQVLRPTHKPGDIVVLDNLAVHQVAGIVELIESRGAAGRYPVFLWSQSDWSVLCQAQNCPALGPHPPQARRSAQARPTDDHSRRCADLVHPSRVFHTLIGNWP
jgi:hypothetical protein